MKNSSMVQMVIRIFGLIQLVLGVILWTGNADALKMIHILVGSIFTIALFVVTYLAYRAGVSRPVVILAAVWALILPIWGLSQETIFPQSYVWISQVLHLLCGIGAIGLAEMMSAQVRKKSLAPVRS